MSQPYTVQDKLLHSVRLGSSGNPSTDIELVSHSTGRSIKVTVAAHPAELNAAYQWVLEKLKAEGAPQFKE